MRKHIQNLHLRMQTATAYILSLGLVLALVPTPFASAADNNKLIVTSAPASVDIGTSFTVYIKSYTAVHKSIATANGTVSYPSNLLRVKGTSPSGSNYGSPSISQGSGAINFSASVASPTASIMQIFSIEFLAIGAGKATVGFGGNSQVDSATTEYVSGSSTITDPNPPTTSNPTPVTPKPSTVVVAPVPIVTTPAPVETPTASSEPVATPDPTGLLSDVAIKSLYTKATVTWKVNSSNPSSTFSYGASASQLDKIANVTKNADGTFSTAIDGLTPGNRYYFVISGSGDGGKAGTYGDTITTIGFPVTLIVTENNVAASSAQITINNRTYQTATNGKKTIGLAAGSYQGKITTETSTQTINFKVEAKAIPSDDSEPEAQSFTYNLTSSPLAQAPGSELSIFTFIGILLGGTVILGIGFFGFIAYRRRRFESGTLSHTSTGSTVVIDDGYEWRGQLPSASGSPVAGTATNIPPVYNNSVHIDDEEPLDMYEQAKQAASPTSHEQLPSPDQLNVTEQNPSSQHSTKL